MTRLYFSNSDSLGMGNEATCALDIFGPTATASFVDVLVDTGADYIMVPQLIATRTGINLAGATRLTVRGVGGNVSMWLASGVSINVNGSSGNCEVLFNPDPSSMPLVGRNGIELIKNIGFESTQWHWN